MYSYNLRKAGTEVEEIALHRSISVTVGVLWATILNQLVWPFEARRELAGGLSEWVTASLLVAICYISKFRSNRKHRVTDLSALPPPSPPLTSFFVAACCSNLLGSINRSSCLTRTVQDPAIPRSQAHLSKERKNNHCLLNQALKKRRTSKRCECLDKRTADWKSKSGWLSLLIVMTLLSSFPMKGAPLASLAHQAWRTTGSDQTRTEIKRWEDVLGSTQLSSVT